MRLLERNQAGEICLTKDFIGDDPLPPYAILSHTWGAEEVIFKDLVEGTGENKLGYHKIQFCGDQGWRDGLRYFWVDTCCIDKTNSTELQESINSMFRWYRDAAKCYVYLADVPRPAADEPGTQAWESAFRKSRWFTRGWTLQELIAPASVDFFSKDGVHLGNKRSLEQLIHNVTGIPVEALRGGLLSGFSVLERISWMEHRETTRKEDKAYSLLGIFDVQMPLIYGEGRDKAFKRLLEEVNKAAKGELLIPTANDAAFDSRAEEHNARCHPDTRIALLNQMQAWIDDADGDCIFWLNGVAGTGKSTISRTIACRFKEQGLLGASFFFKRGERDRGDAALFFTTIADQLVSKEPRMLPFVREAIESDPRIATKALKEQFEKLILQPLAQIHRGVERRQTVAIVIDALDECENDNDIKLIIYLFSQMGVLPFAQFRVLITSRPDLPIRLGFQGIKSKYQHVALHQLPEQVLEHDISVFLKHELARIRDDYNIGTFDVLQLPLDWPSDNDMETLVHMAVPLFIFAATVCRFLNHRTSNPADQLRKVLGCRSSHDSGFDQLDSTYLPVLNQLVAGRTDEERSHLLSEFRGIVGPVVLLAEPLSALSLSYLLNTPLRSIAGIVNNLHAILDVPSKAESPIKLFHLSFRDYLVDFDKRGSNPFWIDEVETHKIIAANCLELLSSKAHLKRDICSLGKPGIARTDVDAATINKHLPAVVRYACLYWVHHLKRSGSRIMDGGQAHLFLKSHLLHWLEALSFVGKVSESIIMIKTLHELLEPGKSAELSTFLRDARIFIFNCHLTADVWPLQIYSSALVFTSENSMIRRVFEDQIPDWISQLRNADSQWGASLQTLEGHHGPVWSVTFLTGSTKLASASEDKTIKIWDAVTGACIQTIMGHNDAVSFVTSSQDGIKLASISYDNTIKIWDATTGICLQTLMGHGGSICSATFLADSKKIASASEDETIKIWDIATGSCIQTLIGHYSAVSSVASSQDGRKLASASWDNILKIWDVDTGICLWTLRGHHGPIWSVAFLADGTKVASASEDKTIKIWDPNMGECCRTLTGHSSGVNSVAFSRDGTKLVSGAEDDYIKVWDVITGTCVQTLKDHSCAVYSTVFSDDGTLVASASWDKTIKIWDMTTDASHQTHGGYTATNSIAFSQDGAKLASGLDNNVKVWDAATAECLQTLEGHRGPIWSVAFLVNGTKLASASEDKTIKIWDALTGACIQTLTGHNSAINSIASTQDGKVLASASADNSVRIWDIAKGVCLQVFKGHEDCVRSMEFSCDGAKLASASSDYTVKVWDTVTGICLQTLKGHLGTVWSVTFSTDNTLLASASSDYTVKIWDVATAACKYEVNVGTTLYNISFKGNGSKIGAFSLDTPSTSTSSLAPQTYGPRCYGVSADNTWITWNSQNLLRLPPLYQLSWLAVAASTVTICCPSGRVVILHLSIDRLC
ncbi:vegetative incompatibility protein HET-E-1 [Trichoderma evansii]